MVIKIEYFVLKVQYLYLSFGETREVSQGFFVNTFDNQIPSQSTPIDQQQFQDVNSRLNTNSLGNNQNPNNFDNPSSPLAFQNSQSPEMNQNQDNQNSWGDWNQDLQALLDEKIMQI
ncbi:hypothetical protein MASR2M54_24470 [Aliarcobacter cryaerophilus]